MLNEIQVKTVMGALRQIASKCGFDRPKACQSCSGSNVAHPDYEPDKHVLETCDQYIAWKALQDLGPKCGPCHGAGWCFGDELKEADEDTRQDTMTKYTCDWCGGIGVEKEPE